MWRTILFAVIAGIIVGSLLGILLVFTDFTDQTNQYILEVAGYLVGIPIGIWVLSLVFKKSFSDFKIVLIQNEITETHDV